MPIFKYLTSERIDVLINAHIRFTQPAEFNDPFEAFPYFKQLTTDKFVNSLVNESLENDTDFEKMLEESWQKKLVQNPGVQSSFSDVKPIMTLLLKQQMPFISNFLKEFAGMRNSFFRQFIIDAILKGMNNEIGILSLTENKDNLLMWSHYSSKHTGFVIEFDETNPFFDQRSQKNEIRGHLKKVRYSLKRPEVTLYDPEVTNDENAENWIKNIFWVKSKHWEYEQEWRMGYTLRHCKKIFNAKPYDIYLFPFPKKLIKSVYLGCRMPISVCDKIHKILDKDNEYSHVKIFQAKINDKDYKLDHENV